MASRTPIHVPGHITNRNAAEIRRDQDAARRDDGRGAAAQHAGRGQRRV